MSINVYTGLMGSGKSYEVVCSVIVLAVAAGRNVVTNIDGLQPDFIYEYVIDKLNIDPENVGKITLFEQKQIEQPNFFPTDYSVDEQNSFVKKGDLVVVDEAWRIWGYDCKIMEEHKIFFREHRHFVNEKTGVACDLVAIVQDIADLHKMLKLVVEFSFRTKKLKAIGMDNSYALNMWNGWKQYEKNIMQSWTKKYNPEIFPLYKSYASNAQAKELRSDSRSNIFNNKSLKIKIVLYVIFAVIAFYMLYNAYQKKVHPDSSNKDQNSPLPIVQTLPSSNLQKPVENEYRIIGTIEIDGFKYVVLNSQKGLRFESPLNFSGFGSGLTGVVDGKTVTRYTGQAPQQSNDKKLF